MSYLVENEFSNNSRGGEAEQTLRLIAQLPAPEGLEDPCAGRSAGGAAKSTRAGMAGSVFSGGRMGARGGGGGDCVCGGRGCWGIYSRVQPGVPVHGVAGRVWLRRVRLRVPKRSGGRRHWPGRW